MTPERFTYLTGLALPSATIEPRRSREAMLECLAEIEHLQADTDSNDCWMREVLTDFNIPYDDHKVGRRLAITRWMRDRNAQNERLQAENAKLKEDLVCLDEILPNI